MATAAHTGVLELEGAKAQVVDLNYSFHRPYDTEKGQPTRLVRNGLINVTIRSDEKEFKGKAIQWMAQQDLAKAGSVTIFTDAEQKNELVKIEFENAYIVSFDGSYNSMSDSSNTLETFGITAEIIKLHGAEMNMAWAS